MSSTSVSAVFCWRQTGHTETPVCPLERASGKVASPGMWVLTRARASSPCTPALHPPSHGVGAAAQPSLFPPGKASPSPWIERLPSGRRSPRPHHAHGQPAQAASAGSERRQRAQAALPSVAPAAPRHARTSPAAGLGPGVWKPLPERNLL